MKTWTTFLGVMAMLLVAAIAPAHAAIIYEPFADSDATLNGNTTGTGLSGNWTAGDRVRVASGSIDYGTLPTSGNRVSWLEDTDKGGWDNASATQTALGSKHLLDDGATVWFSFLARWTDTLDDRFALALTTDAFGYDLKLNNSGSGIGFGVSNSNKPAAYTFDGSTRDGNPAASTASRSGSSGTEFWVGKIVWGADGASNDTLEIYQAGTDLVLPASAVSTKTAVLDQSAFDTIAFTQRHRGGDGGDFSFGGVDEIRFGATYNDVIGAGAIPEPSTFLIWALGLLGLAWYARRRRTK